MALSEQDKAKIRRWDAVQNGMDIHEYNDAIRNGDLTLDYRADHPGLLNTGQDPMEKLLYGERDTLANPQLTRGSPTGSQQTTNAPNYYTALDASSGFGPSGGGESSIGQEYANEVDFLRSQNPIDLTDEQGLMAFGPQWSMLKGSDRNLATSPVSNLWGQGGGFDNGTSVPYTPPAGGTTGGSAGGATGGTPDPTGMTDEQLAALIAGFQEQFGEQPSAPVDMMAYQGAPTGSQGGLTDTGIQTPDYGQVQQRPAYDFSQQQQSQPMSIKQAQVNNFHNAAHSDWQGKQQEMQNGLLDMGQYRQKMGLLG